MDGTIRDLMPLRDDETPPALFRWGGIVLGVVLVSDALRRFLIPASRRDLYGFLVYLVLGVACLALAGYRRAFVLDDRGLVRETTVWGRSRHRLLLSWEDMTGILWDPEEGGGTARFAAGGVAWRLRVPERGGDLAEWIARRRPDLGNFGPAGR